MNYIKLMRPKHYIKNFLIFLPLIFGESFFNLDILKNTILAFFAFSFATSIVYIINDIKDKEKDKLHEKKKNRPIASGKVSVRNAIILVVGLLMLSLSLQYLATRYDSSYELSIYTSIYCFKYWI